MVGLHLLQKTELWVNEITFGGVDLTDMAAAVAASLALEPAAVLVADVRPAHITFDVLVTDVPPESMAGRGAAVLKALAALPGVVLTDRTRICSSGILGLIRADAENRAARTTDLTAELMARSSKRAIVFSVGLGGRRGPAGDGGAPCLKRILEARRYAVKVGERMENSPADIRAKLSEAVARGYSPILVTGGMGAGDGDHVLESILRLDPGAAAFRGDGARIGVGRAGVSLMVSLPGVRGEVEAAAPVLLRGLEEGWSRERLADRLAGALAENRRGKRERLSTPS